MMWPMPKLSHVNLSELDSLLTKAGTDGVPRSRWESFDGSTMTTQDERDQVSTRVFASEEELSYWLLCRELKWRSPRPGAVLHKTLIEPASGPALWQVSVPVQSGLRARGDGMLAIIDTSDLMIDPQRGAAQITVVDATTGSILSTWLPPHGAMWLRFQEGALVVDDGTERATVCDPLTGEVLGQARPGVRLAWTDPLLPNILLTGKETSRLESPHGTVLWTRPGWVWSEARAHGLSIIGTAQRTVVEAVRDDGASAWSVRGLPATVTADTVWIDQASRLLIVDISTGDEIWSGPSPWGANKLYELHNGWGASDCLVVISDEHRRSLAAYTERMD
jgi:outer membrane protein assembly factor BamB